MLMALILDVDSGGLCNWVLHVSTLAVQLNERDTETVLDGKTCDDTPIEAKQIGIRRIREASSRCFWTVRSAGANRCSISVSVGQPRATRDRNPIVRELNADARQVWRERNKHDRRFDFQDKYVGN
jgi:hypothetical protein